VSDLLVAGYQRRVTVLEPARPNLEIELRTRGQSTTVRPTGRLVGASSATLESVFRSALAEVPDPAVLDLSLVTEMDPAAVAMLLRLKREGLVDRCVDVSTAAGNVLRATGAALVLGLSSE
jgi:anti-anti-sigma regulatory factor